MGSQLYTCIIFTVLCLRWSRTVLWTTVSVLYFYSRGYFVLYIAIRPLWPQSWWLNLIDCTWRILGTGLPCTACLFMLMLITDSCTSISIAPKSRQLPVQTLSDVCLKRTCSLDTSAFSALQVLTITALYKFTYLLTYLLTYILTPNRYCNFPKLNQVVHNLPIPKILRKIIHIILLANKQTNMCRNITFVNLWRMKWHKLMVHKTAYTQMTSELSFSFSSMVVPCVFNVLYVWGKYAYFIVWTNFAFEVFSLKLWSFWLSSIRWRFKVLWTLLFVRLHQVLCRHY